MRLASTAVTAFASALLLATAAFSQPSDAPVVAYRMGPGMMGPGFAGPGMMGGGAMGPGMMGGISRYPDGYIAFLKAEIKITSAQEGAWSKLADALRAQASAAQSARPRGMMGQGAMGPAMMSGAGQSWQPQALPDALDDQVTAVEQQLATLKAVRDAAKPLYAKLSDEQKARADQLLGCPMCGW